MEEKVLLIIPAYNEQENLPALIETLRKFSVYDFLIINDCSTDHTLSFLEKSGVNYLNLPINLGIGGAVQSGYLYALRHGYDYAVQVDGDGQHNPEFIQSMIERLNQDADLVIGSRFIKNEGFQSSATRRIGIKFLSVLIRMLTGVKITDPTSGFRACNRKVIEYFAARYPDDYPEPETIISCINKRFVIREVPVLMNERLGGKSSINAFKSVYYMLKVSLAILISHFEDKAEECDKEEVSR